jgi:hypothetical protein
MKDDKILVDSDRDIEISSINEVSINYTLEFIDTSSNKTDE